MRRDVKGLLVATLAVLLCLGITWPAYAGFNRIVRAIEANTSGHYVRIPFLGVAKIAVRVAHPEGVSGIQLAIFEDTAVNDPREFESDLKRSIGDGWFKMVAVRSRPDKELVYLFVKTQRRKLRLLVVAHDEEETVVVQLKARPDALMKYVNDPELATEGLARADHQD